MGKINRFGRVYIAFVCNQNAPTTSNAPYAGKYEFCDSHCNCYDVINSMFKGQKND